MKTRCENRKGGRPSPHFVLRNRTEHLYYTRHRSSAKYERFMKTFLKRDKTVAIEDFSAKKTPLYFLLSFFFLFIMCLPRNSILCYASIFPSMLEELRPVSA